MPKEGSNITKTPQGRWRLRFKVKETVLGEDGQVRTFWKDRERTFDSKADAQDYRAGVRLAASRGERWRDQRNDAIVTLGAIAEAYKAAASAAPLSSQGFRKTMMNKWLEFAGNDTPATELSLTMLERYARSLSSEGRAAGTRHRKILAVEAMWRWARRRPDQFPGVPEPMEITGDDMDSVKAPPPVVRLATPDWYDVDQMIGHIEAGARKYPQAHRRAALIMRFTGMRVAQAVGLNWEDVKLDYSKGGAYVVVRAGRRGAKGSRGRVIPLHPWLVEEMKTWGSRTGLVTAPATSVGARWGSGEATRTAVSAAWLVSGVPVEKWGLSESEKVRGERGKGSPCHAIRACVKTELLRAGVLESTADYLIGHTKGATHAAYVPESAPETSPYWSQLVEAIGKMPNFGEAKPQQGSTAAPGTTEESSGTSPP